jgi:hypothetical protein
MLKQPVATDYSALGYMLKQPVTADYWVLGYLGNPTHQAEFKEEILLIGSTWIMTREHPSKRKEWFAYKTLENGIELITGKAKVEPLLLEKGYRPKIEWTTYREYCPKGVTDTITWKRGQKSGSYIVVMLDDPPEYAKPACPKHWKVLAALEPMLFEELAGPEIKSLL